MVRYRNLAVIFPGIGYHCDKPLLYYSKRIADQNDFSVIEVNYSKTLKEAGAHKGDLNNSFNMALEYTELLLKEIDWKSYKDVVFISKSIGSAVAQAFDENHRINARHVIFTPIEQTFLFNMKNSIVFHGTSDPMAKTWYVQQKCEKRNIPLNLVSGANHSLETGTVADDLYILDNVMKDVKEFLNQED